MFITNKFQKQIMELNQKLTVKVTLRSRRHDETVIFDMSGSGKEGSLTYLHAPVNGQFCDHEKKNVYFLLRQL
jgi:hypothetical protein